MSDLQLMLQDYRLTTAEIFYHLPDYPRFLQTYVWQEYDIAPKFPVLKKFLDFWNRELDGKLHSVKITALGIVTDAKFNHAQCEIKVH
jgi:uncharacterized protein Usg